MTDPDIIAQAEAWCNATVTASLETEPELCLDGARLLPQLLAEAKRMQNEIEMYKMGEEAANKLILQGRAAEADRDAWKAKAIEERANLTAEQREALKTVDALLWKHASEPGIQRIGQILYDLRTNAKPAWEITEERKAALKVAVGDMDLSKNIHYLGVLRAMLGEIK